MIHHTPAFLASMLALALAVAQPLLHAAPKHKPAPKEVAQAEALVVTKIVEKVKPSLVKITQFGRDGNDGLGSGFVISKDGLIATNLHVVGQGRRLQVETSDGKTFEAKSVYASDYHVDLALLKIEADNLKPLELGDSDEAKQGQPIAAMGNPQGLAFSVVQGVVSATREIEGNTMIQLAIPIEQGNSGGPLLDNQGRVLGILTLKSLRTENLGFAMPVNYLKKLIDKPNPVPMERWLTIGVLDPRLWKTLLGARWTQHSTVVKSELQGDGFGGRTLCLSQTAEPKVPFEVAVSVKLDDESGAAGLVFCADGGDKHYGFYPTAGQLRLTRFDGPDVFSWTPFQTVESAAYHSGDWNDLRVRVEEKHITCFVNGQKVIEQDDEEFRDGKVGLCRFRLPGAQYRNFRVGSDLTDKPIPDELASKVSKALDSYAAKPATKESTVDALLDDSSAAHRLVVERAKRLEQEAQAMRKLDLVLQQKAVARALAKELSKEEEKIDLLQAALLLAKHDNFNVDPPMYRRMVDRMADELRSDNDIKQGGEAAINRLNRYLFEENGFHGSRHDYDNIANRHMNEVLDDREGLPITLAVLYLEMGQKLGINGLFGASLPGRFMVGYRKEKEAETTLIDVFDGGKMMTLEQSLQSIFDPGTAIDEDSLKPAKKKEVIMRMINNLISAVGGNEGLKNDVLPYLNLTLEIDPDAWRQRGQRAMLRMSAKDVEGTRDDLRKILDNPPPEMDDDQIRQLQRLFQTLGNHPEQ